MLCPVDQSKMIKGKFLSTTVYQCPKCYYIKLLLGTGNYKRKEGIK